MASTKRLKSVAHSLAHHAVSGLSYLHPHLSEACESVGKTYTVIDLVADNPCPASFKGNVPLQLALQELKGFYVRLLESEGFQMDAISSTTLLFSFNLKQNCHYCSTCTATIHTVTGTVFEKTVDYLGNEVTRAAHNIPVDADGCGAV